MAVPITPCRGNLVKLLLQLIAIRFPGECMTHHLLDYPRKMRNGGYRVTPQRKAILDAICGAGSHATVEEIGARLLKHSHPVNRATLYRNLIFLRKMHLVNVIGTGKARRYEIASPEPHHHLVCRKCGREVEIDCKCVERFKAAIRKNRRFFIDDDHLVFYGVCGRCSSGRSRKLKGETDHSK
jgi:Fe2+ or Zn2+ uptake regulation protein